MTFLFSDIEGSTVRWDAHPEAMQDAVRRHDALMRAAIESNSGYVFKTIGDAFCAAFPTAKDGVAAALIAQQTLDDADFTAVDGVRVRMALHTGTADERDNDYFGGTVNRVARLLAIGHGGQVLISGATGAECGEDWMPTDAGLIDLGVHRLRDLSEPEHVFQLRAPGLRDSFPELKSLDHLSNNLPAHVTPLIGRTEEVAEIEGLLKHSRVVTLAGPGGLGKTRVALQVAADLIEADGAWFVDLAPLGEPALVPSALAQVFGVRESPTLPLIDSVVIALKKKKLLIVLDNCEHVVAAAAEAVDKIVRSCPDVRILATSREPLAIAGEEVVRMTPLPVPPEGKKLTAESAMGYPAVALFVSRAKAVQRAFELDDTSAPIVAEIVRRLDGIPLAIELAAARVKVLSVVQLRDKLSERFKLLTGGSRTVLPRQQTLRALIDWSYGLLNDDEKRMFSKLGIFSGSFPLDVTVAVCGAQNIDEYEVLDLLTSLVDKSLLVAATQDGGETRYRLLESTREFAKEKLAESGEFEAAARAHALAFTELAEDLQARWFAKRSEDSVVRTRLELDNWRAALQWTLKESNDVALGQRLTAALRVAWARFAPFEGRRWIVDAFAATPPEPEVAARLYMTDAHLAMLITQYKAALSSANAALALLDAARDRRLVAEARLFAGAANGLAGQAEEGEALLQLAMTDFTELGAYHDAGSALQYLGVLKMNAGDVSGSRAFYAQAHDAYQKAGARASAAQMAINLAEVEFQCGNAEKALELVQGALESDRGRVEEYRLVYDLCNMAAYEIALGRFDAAARHAAEVLSISQETGSEFGILVALQRLAALAVLHRESGDSDPSSQDVARLLGFIDVHLEEIGFVRDYTERQEYDRVLSALDGLVGSTAYSEAMTEGRLWPVERAVALGEAIAARFCSTDVADND